MTTLLANAETYSPSLGGNVFSGGVPLAAVFDRAREEGFAKMISLCTIRSHSFRLFILGQTLDRHGACNGESMIEAVITLLPSDSKPNVTPIAQEIKWL